MELLIDAVNTESIDRVIVTIEASSPEGDVCRESPSLFLVSEGEDLPLKVWIEQGDRFTDGFIYRASGYQQEQPRLGPLVGWETWPDEGMRTIEMILGEGCYSDAGSSSCTREESCDDGVCVGVELPEALVEPENLVEESCLVN